MPWASSLWFVPLAWPWAASSSKASASAARAFCSQVTDPIDPQVLSFVKEFGLVLFVFTMGLQLGPGFFASLRAEGLRLNMLAAVLVLSAGLLSPLVGWLSWHRVTSAVVEQGIAGTRRHQ